MKSRKIELYDDSIGTVEYVSHMGTDLTVVNAARVSFGKQKNELDSKDKKLINYLIKHKHSSTLEHNVVTFRFTVPLYVRSQHHRHRTWCLSGATEVTFNRPDRWKKGQHCKQSPWEKGGFTIAELYRKWNTKAGKKRIKNQLVRIYDEKEKKFSVSSICNVMYSGKKDVFKVTLENGKEIKSSKDHLFLTSEGWQTLEKAISLDMSKSKKATISKDSFFLTNGTPLAGTYSKVAKVEYVGEEDTFDLSISGDNHNFVANGIVVHNSYNEVSRRYTEENIQFYEPKMFRTQHKSNRQASNEELINPKVWALTRVSEAVVLHHRDSLNLYRELMEKGVCREQARGVLPQNMYTQYYGTCNLNNLMKFIDLRTHEGAQWEIVKVAEACLEIVGELWPVTVEAYANNR